jgi:AcrR family transcriptional regulator
MSSTGQSSGHQTMQGIKEQFRMERHREFLSTALRIVMADGLQGLTMQRLADEIGCGIGSLYRHFPSKDALIAELEREALDVVNTSFQLSQAHVDEVLHKRGIEHQGMVALARVVAATRFWVAAETVFPQEIDLSRRMFTDPDLHMDESDVARVLPAALRLLDMARQLMEDANSAGALREGPAIQRAIVMVAGTTGVLMTSGLGRFDESLFDGRMLATLMVHDLFLGWGADPDELSVVEDLISTIAEHGQLIPHVRH